jgi:hypothetical protein
MDDKDLDGLSSIDIGQTGLIAKIKEENKLFNRELKKRAKTKEELTVAIECVVKGIISYNLSTSVTPQSEMVYGGKSISYKTGNVSHSEIKILSDTTVKELKFGGCPNVEKGDKIRAYILKGKEEFEKKTFCISYDNDQKAFLVGRDFKEEELTFKIEKLWGNEVIATYISNTFNLLK